MRRRSSVCSSTTIPPVAHLRGLVRLQRQRPERPLFPASRLSRCVSARRRTESSGSMIRRRPRADQATHRRHRVRFSNAAYARTRRSPALGPHGRGGLDELFRAICTTTFSAVLPAGHLAHAAWRDLFAGDESLFLTRAMNSRAVPVVRTALAERRSNTVAIATRRTGDLHVRAMPRCDAV